MGYRMCGLCTAPRFTPPTGYFTNKCANLGIAFPPYQDTKHKIVAVITRVPKFRLSIPGSIIPISQTSPSAVLVLKSGIYLKSKLVSAPKPWALVSSITDIENLAKSLFLSVQQSDSSIRRPHLYFTPIEIRTYKYSRLYRKICIDRLLKSSNTIQDAQDPVHRKDH